MTLARMNISCDEHDVKIARRQRERRWQGGVAGTRSHSLKRAPMARIPLVVTTSDWALATEDINHANDGRAPSFFMWYPCLFLLQTAGSEM